MRYPLSCELGCSERLRHAASGLSRTCVIRFSERDARHRTNSVIVVTTAVQSSAYEHDRYVVTSAGVHCRGPQGLHRGLVLVCVVRQDALDIIRLQQVGQAVTAKQVRVLGREDLDAGMSR